MKPQSTVQQEKQHITKFQNFLQSKCIQCQLEDVSEDELNEYLRWFYHDLRTTDGSYYSPSSLKCIRAAIHRYMTQTLNRNINIIDNDKFASSNRMLTTMSGFWLSDGGEKKKFMAIEENDLELIFVSYDRKTEEVLQNEVIFSILHFLGPRGREELRRIKRSDVEFVHDSNGEKYIHLKSKGDKNSKPNNLRKNFKPSLIEKEYDSQRMNRIYDKKAVGCLEQYLHLINRDAPSSGFLFPRLLIGKLAFSDKQVRGENFLDNFLKNLSLKLTLSKVYTNHSIRCTTITRAKDKGLSNADVCLITGHKNEATVSKYDHPSDERRKMICGTLSIEPTGLNQERSPATRTSMSPLTSDIVTSNEQSYAFQMHVTKRMRIDADGESNRVTITFE